jgi:predicted ArsR family transcriptional regulator
MNPRVIREFGHGMRLRIVNAIKTSEGLSVRELGERLGCSYMAIKRHCVELAARGFLETWRRPGGRGRPEMVYRLTSRAGDLFPEATDSLTVEIFEVVAEVYGPTEPEKLLHRLFSRWGARYAARLGSGGSPPERAARLAELRRAEGYLSEFRQGPPVQIVEYHSRLLGILDLYPAADRLEAAMVEGVVGCRVRREVRRASGLYRCTFTLG